MTRLFPLTLSISLTLIGAAAFAQTTCPFNPVQPGYGPYGPSGYWPYRASTYEEGVLNGWGNFAQGQGWYNLTTSQALINREQARSLALQNQQERVRAFYEARKIRESYLQSQRQATVTSSASKSLVNRKPIEARDAQTGGIAWPPVLRTNAFEGQRRQVEQWAASGAAGSERYWEIRAMTEALKEQLKQSIWEVSPMDYVAATKFLDALPKALVSDGAKAGLAVQL